MSMVVVIFWPIIAHALRAKGSRCLSTSFSAIRPHRLWRSAPGLVKI